MFNKGNEEGVLIELERKGIYVYINKESGDGIVGRTFGHDIIAYECREYLSQQIYKEILKNLKNVKILVKKI